MAYKKKAAATTDKVSVEQKITDLFIAGLEQGIVGWQKPWVTSVVGNVAYDSQYTGYNKLWATLHAAMYGVQPNYATVAGAMKKLGYSYQKGKGYIDSKGNPVGVPIKSGAKALNLIKVCNLTKDKKDASGELILDSEGNPQKYSFPVITSFLVYSIDHLNWDLSKFIPELKQNPLLDSGESIVAGYIGCPEIGHGGDKAYYSPVYDKIQMPNIGQFKESAGYYRTLFHEMVHSTGHSDRLNRPGVANFDKFGSHQYSFEELVAEIGSGMLCELSGIPMDVQNSQAYLNGWIKVLKSEPQWIVKAVAQAKKAVELILGHPLNATAEPEAETETEA